MDAETGFIVTNLISAVFGVILGVIFENPLVALKLKLINFSRRLIFGARPIPMAETFSIGSRRTTWLTIDGDGTDTYPPNGIDFHIKDGIVALPPDIENLRLQIDREETEKRKRGENYQWNGPLYLLEDYAVTRSGPSENMHLDLTICRSDYFSFLATVRSLDRNLVPPPAYFSLRRQFISDNQCLTKPIPFLAQGLGVTVVVLTADHKMLFARRDPTTGVRPGELDISFCESIHPQQDRSTSSREPDIHRTIIRGAQEELGIDLVQSDIRILGFGLDIEFYQWQIIGYARTQLNGNDILKRRSRGLPGKWEANRIELVDEDPRAVFGFISREKLWSTGLVAVYWTLVREFGRKKIEPIAEEFIR